MKITIFGATGRTGSRLVKKALHDKHEVTIVTRQIAKVCFDPEQLRIIEGNVTTPEIVQTAVEGADVIISCLGADDISKPFKMISEGTKNIVEAMQAAGIRRFITMAGSGILAHADAKYRGRVDFPPFLQFVFEDNLRAYKIIRETDLDWTIICPTNMPEGPSIGTYRTEIDYLPHEPKPVSVGDVAGLIYKAVNENLFIKNRVGVAN